MEVKSESEVAQSCLTLRDPMDCSLPGSSVHGIFQARVLEGVPLPSPNSRAAVLRVVPGPAASAPFGKMPYFRPTDSEAL